MVVHRQKDRDKPIDALSPTKTSQMPKLYSLFPSHFLLALRINCGFQICINIE